MQHNIISFRSLVFDKNLVHKCSTNWDLAECGGKCDATDEMSITQITLFELSFVFEKVDFEKPSSIRASDEGSTFKADFLENKACPQWSISLTIILLLLLYSCTRAGRVFEIEFPATGASDENALFHIFYLFFHEAPAPFVLYHHQ